MALISSSRLLLFLIIWLMGSISSFGKDEANTIVIEAKAYKESQKILKMLASPGSYDSPMTKTELVELPIREANQLLNHEPYGIITLRALIKLPFIGKWAIYLPETYGASRILIDGRLLNGYSQPSANESEDLYLRGNQLVVFNVKKTEVEIAIEISNWLHPDGPGIPSHPIIAGPHYLMTYNSKAVGKDIFMIGSLLFMGIYHVALYFMRKSGSENLYFAGFTTAIAIRSAFAGEGRFVSELFPYFNAALSWKIEFLCLFIALPLFHSFIGKFFPQEVKPWTSRILIYLTIPFAIMVIFFDVKLTFYSIKIYKYILIATTIHLQIFGQLAYMRKREASLIFACTGTFLGFTVIFDILQATGVFDGPRLVTYGIMTFIFSNSFVISRSFSRAYNRAKETQREVEILNENLESKVEEQTRSIKSILQNIRQGILNIVSRHDYRIGSDYSLFLEELLENKDLSGKNAIDTVFKNTKLSKEDCKKIAIVIDKTLEKNEAVWQLNYQDLPKETEIDHQGHTKNLEIDWEPVFHNRVIKKILVTIRDVTSIRQLEQESIQNTLNINFMSEIVNIPINKFEDLMEQGLHIIEENQYLLENSKIIDKKTLNTILIDLYTLKRIFWSYNFYMIIETIDTELKEVNRIQINNQNNVDITNLKSGFNKIKFVIEKYIKISEEKLHRNLDIAHSKVLVKRKLLESNIFNLESIKLNSGDKKSKEILNGSIKIMKKDLFLYLDDVFKDILTPVDKLAKDLGKEKPIVNFKSQQISLSRSDQKILKNIFIHILRNSLDHGIEPSEERITANKSPQGHINIDARINETFLRIHYEDDGKGLNLKLLKEKWYRKNSKRSDNPSDQEIASIIFSQGVSTSKSINEISGRGVGMGAIKQYVESSGGSISIHFTDQISSLGYRPFALKIDIPLALSLSA